MAVGNPGALTTLPPGSLLTCPCAPSCGRWSPTINRANVYVGFQVQLDLTGELLGSTRLHLRGNVGATAA